MRYSIVPVSEALVASYHAALDEVARERKYLAVVEAPPIEQTRSFVADNVKAGHPHFVALVEGRVVGWCDVIPARQPTLAHAGELGMGVLRDFRRQGIGLALLKATIDAAWASGLLRVGLRVRAKNPEARALYERLGFRYEGTLAKAVRDDDGFDDLIVMGLLREQAR